MKRFISTALVLLMLFALAACRNTGGNNADPTAAPTAAPAEPPAPTEPVKPTEPAKPTEPTVPTMLPEPTEDPMPSEEWFIDEAWKLVEDINRLYGTEFEKDGCEVRPSNGGVKSLRWYLTDPQASLTVSFVQNEEEDWITGMDHVDFFYEPPIGGVDVEKLENDIINLLGLSLDIRVKDLKKAGYEPDGGEGDLDMAAEYMANYVAGLFTGLPDGNLFKCTDAGVVMLEPYPFEGTTHSATIALMPVDYSNWGAAYADIACPLCAEPEYYGYITIWMNINVVRNDDGSFTASLDFNSY